MKLRSLFVGLLPLALLIACVDDPMDDLLAPVTAVIGPEGGTLETEGFRLEVPEGALDEDTTLSVRKLPKAPAGFEARSEVFETGPDGLQFKREISVRLDFTGDAGGLVVFHSKLGGGGYDELEGTVEGKRITVGIDHFSQIWAGPATSDDGTGGDGGAGGEGGAGGSGGSDEEHKHLAERYEINVLAIDDTHVYYQNYEGFFRIQKDGKGDEETLVENTDLLDAGFIGASTVLKVADGQIYIGGNGVNWMPAAGGDIMRIQQPPANLVVIGMVIDSGTVYFTGSSSEADKRYFVASLDPSDGSYTILTVAEGTDQFGDLAVSGGNVYFVSTHHDGSSWVSQIKSIPVEGGPVTAVMDFAAGTFIPAGETIYYLPNAAEDTLYRLDVTDGKATAIVDGQVGIAALAPEGDTFFYTTTLRWGEEIEVYSVAADATEATGTLAATLVATEDGFHANRIAVDDKYIFVSTIGRPDGVHRLVR